MNRGMYSDARLVHAVSRGRLLVSFPQWLTGDRAPKPRVHRNKHGSTALYIERLELSKLTTIIDDFDRQLWPQNREAASTSSWCRCF